MPSGPPPDYNQQSYHDKVLGWRPAVEANASATPSSDSVSPVGAPSNSTSLPSNSTSSTSILLGPHGYDEKTPTADEHAPPQPTPTTDDHDSGPLSAIPAPITETTPLFPVPNLSQPPSTTYTCLYPLVEPDLSEPNSPLLPDGTQPSSPGPQRWVPTSPTLTSSPSVVAARSAADAAPAERNRWSQLLDAQRNEVNQYQQNVQPFIQPGNRRMVLVPSSLEDPQPVSVYMQEGTHEWGWEWGIVGALSLLFCFPYGAAVCLVDRRTTCKRCNYIKSSGYLDSNAIGRVTCCRT